jgi:hypothetical protein
LFGSLCLPFSTNTWVFFLGTIRTHSERLGIQGCRVAIDDN